MSSAASLVDLGERYAALGLPAAARGAFLRALALSADDDSRAARCLAELHLASGDGVGARDHAREVVKREPGPASRVLLGRTQLAAGEITGARMSFSTVLAAATCTPLVRTRAHLGLAAAAAAQRDHGGAAANTMAAVDAFCDFVAARGRRPEEVDAEIELAEELMARAAEWDRADDVAERLDQLAARCGGDQADGPDESDVESGAGSGAEPGALPGAPMVSLLIGLLLAARQRRGEEISDAEIERALSQELARRPGARAVRLRLIERQLKRIRDPETRAATIAALEALSAEISGEVSPGDKGGDNSGDARASGAESGEVRTITENVELARIYFLLASAHEDDPATAERAEAFYRKGLALRPGHAAAANRLALLTLARGDSEAAMAEIERALRIDAGYGLAWRNAARVLDASSPGPGLPALVGRLLDAAIPGAGTAAGGVAPQLVTATAEVARGDVLAGMYTRGHRLKNVLGIIGSRTRSVRKLAQKTVASASGSAEGAGPGDDGGDRLRHLLGERLGDLEREVTDLYEEWATYLRAMQGTGYTGKPVVEVISTAALINEVVEAVSAASPIPVQVAMTRPLPDLRGDRLLLREALLNIVSNAAEACAQLDPGSESPGATAGTRVDLAVRTISSSGTPIIEIEVSDDGPGIPRADLARVFVPGFTTKDTGSGVGLSVAERAITGHHGRIVVDSEVGRGTRFIIILPTDLGGFTTLAAYPGRGEPDAE